MIYYMYLFLCITIQATIKDAKMFVVFFFWNVMLHNTLDAGLYCYIYDQILLKWSILHIFWFWKKYKKPFYSTSVLKWQKCVIKNGIDLWFYYRDQWKQITMNRHEVLQYTSLTIIHALNKLKYKYSTAETPFCVISLFNLKTFW